MIQNSKLGSLMYDGTDSRKMLAYQRDRINSRAVLFRDKATTIQDHLSHNGAGIIHASHAFQTQEALLLYIPSAYMIFVLGWIDAAADDATHASRVAEAITRIHHNDQRMTGLSLQDAARASRARYYAIPGNDIHMKGVPELRPDTPAVPAVPEVLADPALGIAYQAAVPAVRATVKSVIAMPTPVEGAESDVIDAKMTEQQRKHFAMLPGHPDINARMALQLDALPLAPEREDIRRQLDLSVAAVLAGEEMPSLDFLYWKSLGAIHAKATPAQTTAFLTITPLRNETMEAWSIRFYLDWDFNRAWLDTTPKQLAARFMNGVRIIDEWVYQAVMGEFKSRDFTVDEARDNSLQRWRAFELQRRAQAQTDGLRNVARGGGDDDGSGGGAGGSGGGGGSSYKHNRNEDRGGVGATIATGGGGAGAAAAAAAAHRRCLLR